MKASLNGNGINPHKLKLRKDIAQRKSHGGFLQGHILIKFSIN